MKKSNRYTRQTGFQPFGETGQHRLSNSRVLICGSGALGSAIATLLVRAGVGFLRLIDDDVIQRENLHRQILFDESDADLGRYKVEAATERLRAANSEVLIEPVVARFSDKNAQQFVERIDLIVDGTDNFPSRFLLNRVAVQNRIPFITAGVLGCSGQIFSILPGQTPCLNCLLGDENELCSENSRAELQNGGILASTVLFAASLEVNESLKILSGNQQQIIQGLLQFDLWNNRIRQWTAPIADCAVPCPVCHWSDINRFHANGLDSDGAKSNRKGGKL
ncbi:MAG: HesA/MoeB/ThiF family protein [Thermoguttaceae bacterium]